MAPRLLLRPLTCAMRGAGLMACLWLAGGAAAHAQQITGAQYDGPVTRYGHLVLGKDHNWDSLVVTLDNGTRQRLTWQQAVFEDTAPRVVEIDGVPGPEVLVIESLPDSGARVAIYGLGDDGQLALRAATPYIGRANRWYALAGAADLDGDGTVEVAFVDRPHLAKVLRIWQFGPQGFTQIASLPGVTNHRIGEDWISGGIRNCAGRPEIILARGDWSQTLAVTLLAGQLSARTIAPDAHRRTIDKAMTCTDGS